MAMETTPWTPTIASEDDAALYLEACLDEAIETGNHRIVTAALGDIARARGMTNTAREAGLSREGLHKALSERGDPKLSTVLAVMKSLGMRLVRPAA